MHHKIVTRPTDVVYANPVHAADLDAITALVTTTIPGGYATLDSTVRKHLQEWFVRAGSVRSAARLAFPVRQNAAGAVWTSSTSSRTQHTRIVSSSV